jgi:hypothetical protein
VTEHLELLVLIPQHPPAAFPPASRPPKDGTAKRNVRHGFPSQTKRGFNITRVDIAVFSAAQLDDKR